MQPFVLAGIGGALIGLSAVLLMSLSGRIAGISGIIGGLLPPKPASDRSWRLAFVVGLVAAPALLGALTGDKHIGPPVVGLATLIAAGLLVGAGTALGGGCTSGHGICGISRLSPRSMTAVATFMAAGAITVFLTRHVL
jgi:uncharacterized membrane protein YedE/YeeE